MRRKSRKRSILFALIFLLICIVAEVVLTRVFTEPESEWDDSLSQSTLGQITYDGKQYRYNRDLVNILFLGIDNSSGIQSGNTPSTAGQADCILILALDKKEKTVKILQIPRDTMTEVDIYNSAGNKTSSVTSQIATQYAYCVGGKSSCFAVKQTVSELLYDLPIDAYLAMDYTSIAPVNDAVGGVKITVPKDYTMIDPAFQEGATLTLKGEQSHRYVRWRDINASFSNNDRMERQVQYISALVDTIRSNMEKQDDYYKVLYPLVEAYMVTDMSEEQFRGFEEYTLDHSNIRRLPGEGKKGEVYEEFYPDEKKLQKILIETFYILEE